MIDGEISDDQIEEWIGPWWIHIGDDFIKDIVASNSLKMRNIWTRELLRSSQKAVAPPSEQQKQQQSQRSVDELMQLVNEKKVVEMSIGADTYLADTVSSEFATAVVDELRDVVSILQKWQDEIPAPPMTFCQGTYSSDMKVDNVMSTMPPPTIVTKDNVNSDTKFCIACGTKLPLSAKFCSACGEAQQ